MSHKYRAKPWQKSGLNRLGTKRLHGDSPEKVICERSDMRGACVVGGAMEGLWCAAETRAKFCVLAGAPCSGSRTGVARSARAISY